jgi:hypothetical protein
MSVKSVDVAKGKALEACHAIEKDGGKILAQDDANAHLTKITYDDGEKDTETEPSS